MFLVTSAFPQVSEVRPDMRERALFVTGRAACPFNNSTPSASPGGIDLRVFRGL